MLEPRERVPSLRQREQSLRAELQAMVDQAGDRAKFLHLAETTAAFLVLLRHEFSAPLFCSILCDTSKATWASG